MSQKQYTLAKKLLIFRQGVYKTKHLPRIYNESVADTHLNDWICHTFYVFSWKVFARNLQEDLILFQITTPVP